MTADEPTQSPLHNPPHALEYVPLSSMSIAPEYLRQIHTVALTAQNEPRQTAISTNAPLNSLESNIESFNQAHQHTITQIYTLRSGNSKFHEDLQNNTSEIRRLTSDFNQKLTTSRKSLATQLSLQAQQAASQLQETAPCLQATQNSLLHDIITQISRLSKSEQAPQFTPLSLFI